jgi:DNA polymerase-4/DNA polymerase V
VRLALDKMGGIGSQTKAFLEKHGMHTALDFARKDEAWVARNLTKPHVSIWKELRGECVFALDTSEKQTYYSIQKVNTFTPPTNEKAFLLSQLSKNIENACIKLRRYRLAANQAVFFLNRQDFSHQGVRVRFSRATSVPSDVVGVAEKYFDEIYDFRHLYRTTGVVLFNLESNQIRQMDLFGELFRAKEVLQLYDVVDAINKNFGKHKVHLASSLRANVYGLHQGERGDVPQRKKDLFLGESKRKRVGIPMFTGAVS